MKKSGLTFLVILVFTIMAALIVVPTALAEGAIIVRNGACTLFDGDGGIADGVGKAVANNDVVNLRCSAKDVANSTGASVYFDSNNNPYGVAGLPVNCGGIITTNWSETVSASGNATLQCSRPR